MHVGRALRRLRLESGASLRDLARRLGISSAYLSRLEHGLDAEPTPERLSAFAEELGLPSALLLELGHRLGPWAGRYVEQRPAAAALFLSLVRRDLGREQLLEIVHFIEQNYPLPEDRIAPTLAPMLEVERVALGVEGGLAEGMELAAKLLTASTDEDMGAHLATALMKHHTRIPSGIGDGVIVPVARWMGPPMAALLTFKTPLEIETPDSRPVSVAVIFALPGEDPKGLARIGQVARLAARGLVTSLSGVEDAETALAVIDELESP